MCVPVQIAFPVCRLFLFLLKLFVVAYSRVYNLSGPKGFGSNHEGILFYSRDKLFVVAYVCVYNLSGHKRFLLWSCVYLAFYFLLVTVAYACVYNNSNNA